jgi:hypothetical protein
MERWDGVPGSLVSDLTANAAYPDNPTVRSYPTLFELPTSTADNYGSRMRGYITPPTTGNYIFWIASDDNSELWLGTSSDPATARQIASVPSWTNSREWTKFTQQQSASIALTAGSRYYIETRHKEGASGDNLAVGWQGPGITGEAERPIPGARLAPFVLTAPVAKTILAERWDGISGTSVANLTSNANYPNNPTSRSYATLYELAGANGDNYGTRTRGYVTPPTTGNYTFWIASDDNSELWLGTSSDPATARRIALVSSFTNSREWTKMAEQQSAAIALTGGTRYYIETRHKEGTGGDNLAVGWQGPGITGDAERPIPGARLAPFILASPPAITSQPANQTVGIGQTATFSVTATGAAPLNYQWRRNGADIAGANAASYTTPAVASGDNGALFSVTVGNSLGTVTSDNAVLTIGVPPSITLQPAHQTVNVGAPANFAVTATGTAPLSYQWRRNGADIPGATSASYAIATTVAADDGAQFAVLISNPAGSVLSSTVLLTVNVPPRIVTQPVAQTVNGGQTATFSLTATGTRLSYGWRKDGSLIIGAPNAPTYTTPPTTAAMDGSLYSCYVTNTAGADMSLSVRLTVLAPPVITTQPANQSVNLGQTATFFVAAAGSGPLVYQWRKNGADIGGATFSSYTTPAATAADNGAQFSVVVSNAQGNVTSSIAVLSVGAVPPAITTQPASQSVAVGQTALFTVAASGSAPLAYQWRKNGINIGGATAASYTTPAATAADNGALFSVVVSNASGTATSTNAVLTVVSPPVITTQPASQTVNLGQTATFTVTASGSAPLGFQWRKNGANITGATAAAYTTPATVAADNGALFSVVVSNSLGSVPSANAILTVISVTPNARKIAVSGELVDAAGNPLGYPAPVTVDAIVKLYTDPVAGTNLYTEDFRAAAGKGVRVSNGLFVARMGEGVSSQNLQQVLTANPNLWVEITIDDGSPDILSPRTPLTASPYSLGGTPAPAVAAALSGNGDPNLLGVTGDVGATYVNGEDNSTWFKMKSTWKRLD